MKTCCTVPAKLILSGEHAVLYQCPALSMAIDFSTQCECSFQPSDTGSIMVELVDYQEQHIFPTSLWQSLATQAETRYQLFENKTGAIQAVLNKPIDLILVTLQHFDALFPLKKGQWHFKIHSNAPIGRGLGSSAAVILSLLRSLAAHQNIDLSHKTLLALAQRVESRQHGTSSGIDPVTMIHGGLLQYQSGKVVKKLKRQHLSAWLIDSGKPNSTTGECVAFVKAHHDKTIWSRFRHVTNALSDALALEASPRFKLLIRQNNQLLIQLGVVPTAVQTFIQKLESDYDASAKVCGAGAVKGQAAGMIICFSQKPPAALCKQYGYPYQSVALQTKGILIETLKQADL